MEILVHYIAAFLILAYGGLGLWLVLKQSRSGNAIGVGLCLLLGGAVLRQYVFVAAEFLCWVLVIAIVLFLLKCLFS
jgi:hypothetical protein